MPAFISARLLNPTALPSMLSSVSMRAGVASERGAAEGAEILARMIRTNASQRPGPVIQTGRLVGSIRVKPLGSAPSTYRFQVLVDAQSDQGAPYPRFLERGTSRMKPYPFLGPAMAQFRPMFRMIVARNLGGLR